MIDAFALGLTHALMALAAWRLIRRNDLDHEPDDIQPIEVNPDNRHA